jgi:maleylacetoacetate isomerase
VPQLGAARRYDLDLSAYPRLLAVEANCIGLPAFRAAHPDAQPDRPAKP